MSVCVRVQRYLTVSPNGDRNPLDVILIIIPCTNFLIADTHFFLSFLASLSSVMTSVLFVSDVNLAISSRKRVE